MLPHELDHRLDDFLNRRQSQHQRRERVEVRAVDSTHLESANRQYINFASNNYLGLTHHPEMLRAISESLQAGGGSGAAGLISGYTPLHRQAEEHIARWKGTQASLLLPSGYQANVAAIQTLGALGNVRFLLDKLVHASLIDAARAAGQDMRIFPHNGLRKLERLLGDADASQMQVVITESIFSMDGDAADLGALADLKERFRFILMLDEAHATGVYGPSGAGYAAEMKLQRAVDVSVVTFSKAAGCAGGAICASQKFCDTVLNAGRAYIYSTSVPPMMACAAVAAIDICCTEPQRQHRVRRLAAAMRQRLTAAGFSIPAGDSPIIPIIMGDETRALAASTTLRQGGFWVVAVRPPTVPAGGSRLRITLSCDHTDEEIESFCAAVETLR